MENKKFKKFESKQLKKTQAISIKGGNGDNNIVVSDIIGG